MNSGTDRYSIGRLKGRYVATWWEGSSRRRFRLNASTLAEAEAEAARRCQDGFQGHGITKRADLTPEMVRRLFHYNPETGELTWREGQCAGRRAGFPSEGYIFVRIGPVNFAVHRLAWAHVYGRWPPDHTDHINGIGTDNRLCNLRECTCAENSQNVKLENGNKYGLRGIALYRRTGRYTAAINHKGRRHNLGYYDTAEEAHAAYLAAKADLHTFQPTPRGQP